MNELNRRSAEPIQFEDMEAIAVWTAAKCIEIVRSSPTLEIAAARIAKQFEART